MKTIKFKKKIFNWIKSIKPSKNVEINFIDEEEIEEIKSIKEKVENKPKKILINKKNEIKKFYNFKK